MKQPKLWQSALCAFVALTLAVNTASAQQPPRLPQTGVQVNVPGPMGLEVNTFNGNLYHARTDLSIPARSLPLVINLAYNSGQSGIDAGFGYGWQFNHNLYYEEEGDDILIYRGDGRVDRYEWNGTAFTAPDGVRDTLEEYAAGQYRITSPQGIRTFFDAPAHRHVTRFEDPNGNALSLTYSGSLLVAISEAGGRQLTFDYVDDRLTMVVDANTTPVRTVQFQHNAEGNLIGVTDSMGNTTTYTYDGHLLASVTDPRGNTATITYNGRSVASITTTTTSLAFAYDPNTWTTTVTETVSGGNQVTRYVYDAQGRIVSIEDALGQTVSMVWDADNHLVSYADENGHASSYTYDANGNVLTVTDPLGHVTTYTYDATYNKVTSIRDANGHTTTYRYDARGNLVETIDPLGNRTTFTYDANGNLISTTDANGHTTTHSYNSYGDLIGVADPLGHATGFTYDTVGNMLSTTDPNGHTSSFVYDGLSRMTTSTNPLGVPTRFVYDANGNLVEVVDVVRNTSTYYAYDALNRLTHVTDALGSVTQYSYDQAGNLRTIADAEGRTTTFAYDAVNRLVSETDPLGNITRYTYDAASNLVSKTDANGNTITYTYDVANRLTTVDYPGGAHVGYTYDAVGNVTSIVAPNVSITRSYDSADRLTGVSVTAAGMTRTVSYTYDAAGNRATMTDPDGGLTQYIYDAANRLVSLINTAAQATSYTYDAGNRLTRKDNANGTYALYTYDAANQLLSVASYAPGGATLFGYSYEYDSAGNRTRTTEASGAQTSYQYDLLDRLTEVVFPGGATTTYSYDRVGNRTQMVDGGGTTAYTYDAADRLLSAGATSYGWDANGNRVSKTDAGDTTAYTYDAENRLTGVDFPDGGTNTFTYYPDGRRLSRTDRAGTTTYYIYDGDNVLVEADSTGATVARYTGGLAVDDWLSIARGGATYTYHHDGLGSIVGLTDVSGAVVTTYQYDPFGLITGETGSVENSYRYSGREHDLETGLDYLRMRYYDPVVGRFCTKDIYRGQATNPPSLNRFTYAHGNPIRYIDPHGQAIQFAPIIAIGAISATIDTVAYVAPRLGRESISVRDVAAEFVGGFVSGSTSTILTMALPGLGIASPMLGSVMGDTVKSWIKGEPRDPKQIANNMLASGFASWATGGMLRKVPGRLPTTLSSALGLTSYNKHAVFWWKQALLGKPIEEAVKSSYRTLEQMSES